MKEKPPLTPPKEGNKKRSGNYCIEKERIVNMHRLKPLPSGEVWRELLINNSLSQSPPAGDFGGLT